jgi:sugar phosphate permease
MIKQLKKEEYISTNHFTFNMSLYGEEDEEQKYLLSSDSLIKQEENNTQIENKQNFSTWKFRLAQFLFFLSMFVSYCSIYCFHGFLSIASPLLVSSKILTLQNISLIVLVSKLMRMIPQLFTGGLVDIFGGKVMYVSSHFLLAISLILCSIRTSDHQFYWLMTVLVSAGIISTIPW